MPETPVHGQSSRRDSIPSPGRPDALDEAEVDHRTPTFTSTTGKKYYFANDALACIPLSNPVRKAVMHVITNVWFDRVILALILANSCIMALTDYENINDEYEPIPEGSWRNEIAFNTETGRM